MRDGNLKVLGEYVQKELKVLGLFDAPPKIAKESDMYFNITEKRMYQYQQGDWKILKLFKKKQDEDANR